MPSNVEDSAVPAARYNGHAVSKIKYECDVIFNRVFDFFSVFNKVANGPVPCFSLNLSGGDEARKELEGLLAQVEDCPKALKLLPREGIPISLRLGFRAILLAKIPGWA